MRRLGETALEFTQRLIEAEERALRYLGLSVGVSREEVERAFRRLAFESHPDRNSADAEAGRRFRMLTAAYAFLTGREKNPSVCDNLPEGESDDEDPARSGRYNTANEWGMFLWWRERFF